MDNFSTCQRCGGEIEFHQKGSTQGMFCKNCDWSLVTTYIPKIRTDTTIYSIFIVEADYKNINQIKEISKVCGKNYIDTRILLQQENKTIYEGKAIKILEIKGILDSVGVKYSILPEFNY